MATTLSPAAAAPASRGPYHPHRSVLLPPERVRALSELRPMRAVRDTAWCWLVIAAAWAAVAVHPAWWVVALAIPVIGTRYYALFIIGHDGLHRRIFADRARNDLFTDLCLVGPLGAITRLNNRNHLRHHLHLASDHDPDRHRHACFNKTDLYELFAFVVGASTILSSVRNVFVRHAPRIDAPDPVRPTDGYVARDAPIIIGWQLLLIGGLTAAIGWWAYPVLWLLPVYCFTYVGDNLRSFCEHSQTESDEHADEHRLITYRSNMVERWLIAPMNMNFHAAHHLWVSIPYYNLPAAHEEMSRHPGAAALEVRGSYLAYLFRYAFALPIAGCGTNGVVTPGDLAAQG